MKPNRIVVVGVTGMMVLLAGGCATRHSASPSAAMTRQTEATPSEAALLLYRAGLTPDALAAVGATETDVRNICLAARVASMAQSPTYSELLETEATQTARIQALTEKARAGQASREDREALAAAISALTACRESQEDAAAQVRLAANSNLDETQREWLWNIADARQADAPLHLKVVGRTDGEWRDVRDAVAAAREGRDVTVPAEADAQAAQVLLEMNAEVVAVAWDAVLRPR